MYSPRPARRPCVSMPRSISPLLPLLPPTTPPLPPPAHPRIAITFLFLIFNLIPIPILPAYALRFIGDSPRWRSSQFALRSSPIQIQLQVRPVRPVRPSRPSVPSVCGDGWRWRWMAMDGMDGDAMDGMAAYRFRLACQCRGMVVVPGMPVGTSLNRCLGRYVSLSIFK